ncbi:MULTISPECIES: flagellar filament capping protein FliD [Gracilibacillus]|uniref:flagellar filament capping protein FliD n=1 Tax=Gracilibacillus TaxID=74385 RepID=UPI00082401CC|nr:MULTISPECIES: flagellar filament capping protein FliD [Gracilibacillus]
MRISGMASGMDIDQMVKDLMRAESIPLQKMEQEKQVLEWRRDDYRAMNTLLLDFRTKLAEMRMPSTYRARQVASTNENLITATASSAASQSSFEISRVEQLAKSASWVNGGGIAGDDFDAGGRLIDQKDLLGNEGDWKKGAIKQFNGRGNEAIELGEGVVADGVNVRVNGKGYEVVTDEDVELNDNQVLLTSDGKLTFKNNLSANDRVSVDYVTTGENIDEITLTAEKTSGITLGGRSIVADNGFELTVDGKEYKIDLNSENDGVYQLVNAEDESDVLGSINVHTGRVTFEEPMEKSDEDADIEIKASYQQNYTTFSVGSNTSNGETYQSFIVQGNESLNQVVRRVNDANLGVSMTFDSFTNQLSMRRTETGIFSDDGQDIKVSGNFIENTLRFNSEESSFQAGQNAKFTINGLNTERTSNSFQMDGVTFQLRQTFNNTDETDPIQPVTINVTNDAEAVVERITEFVETYNTLIDSINGKVNETFHRDYDPLTDEERESLSDRQQEDWEEMAKSGLLRHDSLLQSTLSSMRNDFYSPVDTGEGAAYNQLAQIGITTTRNYMDGGKLEINEAKLREAVETDPSAVEDLFRVDGETQSEKGITQRLTDSVNQSMDRIYERAGRATYTNQQFTIGRNLEDMEDRIANFERRLEQTEQRYWRQFTAMEKAMQQANSQAAYMMQQFGGGMGMM